MTCHMGEGAHLFLWSECDQCGTPIEISYADDRGNPRGLISKEDAQKIRDAWNLHHRQCDATRKVVAPLFVHERDDVITYI